VPEGRAPDLLPHDVITMGWCVLAMTRKIDQFDLIGLGAAHRRQTAATS